ncbi:MAG: glycosyltransferase family 2 protein [Ilyomonas sp.]
MKISGFTIIKNAIINDYPVVEAIRSILPLVDEMIVLVGDSDDETEELIKNIDDDKIHIHHSIWDKHLTKGGTVLAAETNKAFQLIDEESDWAFYIQADEVVHEKYYKAIMEACYKYADDERVQGLLFNYLHFYGTYDYVGDSRTWYDREVRIIRNDKSITAYKDAQGFRIGEKKLMVKPINAFVYHYGWVKNPKQMMRKIKNMGSYWNENKETWQKISKEDYDFGNEYDSLEKFTATHPAVMKERIARQNWNVDIDTTKKNFSFKDRILYWFEKATGIRPFNFENYRILKD